MFPEFVCLMKKGKHEQFWNIDALVITLNKFLMEENGRSKGSYIL